MKRDKRGLKNRILHMMMGLGKKFRILSYPINFLVIIYLTIYHTIRKIFVEQQYRRIRTGVLTALCAVILIGAAVVLPTLANETNEEPTTEIVSEEELSLEEAEVEETEIPVETEVPDTPQPTEEVQEENEPVESQAEESEENDPDKQKETDVHKEQEQSDKEVSTVTDSPDVPPVEKQDDKGTSFVAEKKTSKKNVKAAPEKLPEPSYEITADGTGIHTYPLSDSVKIGIRATAPAGAGIDYQWYMSKTPDGEGELLNGNGAMTNTYTVPKDSYAGDYYYYCKIKSVDNDGEKIDSDEVRTSSIVVSIGKGEPELKDFDTSAIENEYYYTGEPINPTIESSCEGMGKAYIVVKDGDNENRPKVESDEPYEIFLHVSEGENYNAATINLNKSIMIRRIPIPTKPYRIDGTKGKVVDGKQWYTSEVTIVPATGYSISTTEDNFADELVYSVDGINQGPQKSIVYLRNDSNKAITPAVTITEKRDGTINIDATKPRAQIEYNDSDFVGNATRKEIVFNLTASDETSGLEKRYYYKSNDKEILTETKLKTVSWTEWVEGDTVSETEDGVVTLYAKVEDRAGNVTFTSTPQLLIDSAEPEVFCDNSKLDNEKSYVADKKEIMVSDENLSHVTLTRNNVTHEDKSGDELKDGSVSFTLNGPSDMALQVVYLVTAEDVAGNQKVTKITMRNPSMDVVAETLDFGSGDDALTYGYESVEAQEVVLKKQGTEDVVPVDSIKIETGDDFEVVPDSNMIRPKQGLHTGTYSAVVRVYYNGENKATTTCRCTVTVKKAKMLVRYMGQEDVGYHTYPDLRGTLDFAQDDFKNGDTIEKLQVDPNFVLPSLYYVDEEGNQQRFTPDMRATQSMRLIPGDGQSSDYEFDYGDGELQVNRHSLRRGYVIDGEKKEGYDWYISPTVAIRPADGYAISRSEDEESFITSDQLITVNGPVTKAVQEKFYVMDRVSGEISSLMTENIKIDNTAPHFRNGEGITVSSDLFSSFVNEITFGLFFNDTKSVSISATDEESGLESIRYCLSDRVVDAADVGDGLDWQTYEGEFSISPEEFEHAIIYAKITNQAGLETYISSNGMVFDNKQPDINCVEKGKEHGIIDEKEYVTEEMNLKVSDRNLKRVTLFAGTNTAVTGSALEVAGDDDSIKVAKQTIPCPRKGSKTYTVVASDGAGNNTEREFTITKPVYEIEASPLKIKSAEYGYETEHQVLVSWKDKETANAKATLSDVILSNEKHFEVKQSGDNFWIVAKSNLVCGNYTTDVTLVYNGNKKVQTTCSFTVEKAVLTATYIGDDVYYHENRKENSVKVTGFVKHNGIYESPETAAGYQEPVVNENILATETRELIPSGGKADNYRFVYESGLLLVERRYATTGRDGQYYIDSKISDSGWYTSDIVIRPKEGYGLLLNETDEESLDSITLKKDTNDGKQTFYVVNKNSGEIYYPSSFFYKKDATLPVINGIEDGATYDANTKEIEITDEYLTSVTVNGEAKSVEQGKAQFTLSAEQETMVYVIVATDCAGNVKDATFVMNQPESVPVDTEEEEPEPVLPSSSDVAVPTATPVIPEDGISKEGIVKKLVKVVQGAPNTSLTTNTKDLAKSVLTNGEQQAVTDGSNANIELRIKNIDSSVPQSDKELIIANLGGYSVGEYMDITLWKKIGSSSEKKVTNTNKPITVTVSVPKELRNGSKKFVVLRIHKGAVSVLPDCDSVANTVTFETDRFSTYVLAYKNGTVTSRATSVANSGSHSSGNTGSSMYNDVSPETGDEAPIVPVTIAFILALMGIVASVVIRKKAV